MQRYFICYKKRTKPKKVSPEFVQGTPVEILSPLYTHLQALPTTKNELQQMDFELVEQIHLLEAEYNKRFQDAKYSIEKNDMVKGVHFMKRSNDVKKRIIELEKRHSEIQQALERIIMNYPGVPIQRKRFEIPPTLN
jgi:hypothetical protein